MFRKTALLAVLASLAVTPALADRNDHRRYDGDRNVFHRSACPPHKVRTNQGCLSRNMAERYGAFRYDRRDRDNRDNDYERYNRDRREQRQLKQLLNLFN